MIMYRPQMLDKRHSREYEFEWLAAEVKEGEGRLKTHSAVVVKRESLCCRSGVLLVSLNTDVEELWLAFDLTSDQASKSENLVVSEENSDRENESDFL